MTDTANHSATHDDPSAVTASLDEGTVTLEDVALSEAEHLVEGGVHFVRSLEFDCFGEGDDFSSAVHAFIANAIELGDYLRGLVESGDATEHERQTLLLLAQRLLGAMRAGEQRRQEEERRRGFGRMLRRYRGQHSGNWQRRTTPRTSSQPLRA